MISLGLLWWWRFAAESIVIGYGAAACCRSSAYLLWKGRAVMAEAAPDDGVAHREFWPPLVRFAVWVWVINLFCHLFGVVDRYMLVHWSGLENAAALALVGHYHASRIVPLLFLSVADLLAGVVMPYLSHDWEVGSRQRVSDRLNLVLKFTSLVMLAGGVAVLWIAPLLFHVAFQGRYDEGLAVMPWTLTYCVWYALLLVAQNYIWCAERTKLGALPLAVGLVDQCRDQSCADSGLGIVGRGGRDDGRHRRWPRRCCTGSIDRAGMQLQPRHDSGCRSRRSRCAAARGAARPRSCCWSRALAVFENACYSRGARSHCRIRPDSI